MKRIIIFLIFIVAILMPMVAFSNTSCVADAGNSTTHNMAEFLRQCASGTQGVSIESTWSAVWDDNLRQRIMDFSGGFLRYAALFAVAAIVIAGVMYTTAYGDGERLKKAKDTAIYACVGLLVALLSYALVNAVLQIIYWAVK